MTTEAAKPAETLKPKSLVSKLAEVMGEIERIPKSGRNAFHGYDYATEADIVSAVRAGMSARGVMLLPSVDKTEWREVPGKSGPKKIVTLTVRFTLHDGESGEKLEFTTLGEGEDQGDKATYKALTGAVKYALLKLFLIPTGDDPEQEAPPAKHQPRASPAAAPPPRTAPREASAKDAKFTEADKAKAARATRLWERAKAAGMSKETFVKWVGTVLGSAVPSNLRTDEQQKQLEDEMTQAEAEAASRSP